MSRIDYSFVMDKAPDVAQAMFVRDIAPELASVRDYEIAGESPGQLFFKDSGVAGADVNPDFEETTAELEDRGDTERPFGGDPEDPLTHRLNARAVPDPLPDVFARHLRVDFTAEGAGTKVRVHGHVERDLHHALELLGTKEHWPETADRPHD